MPRQIEISIFHELGHVLGFVFANRHPQTFLGDFELSLECSCRHNKVIPLSDLYRLSEASGAEEWRRIGEATTNIKRTTAYLTKGILGSVFHSVIEGTNFEDVFSPNGNGKRDLSNISGLNSLSTFKWSYTKDLVPMGLELIVLAKQHNLLRELLPIVKSLAEEVEEKKCLHLKDERILKLVSDMEQVLPLSLFKDMDTFLEKWKVAFEKNESTIFPHS